MRQEAEPLLLGQQTDICQYTCSPPRSMEISQVTFKETRVTDYRHFLGSLGLLTWVGVTDVLGSTKSSKISYGYNKPGQLELCLYKKIPEQFIFNTHMQPGSGSSVIVPLSENSRLDSFLPN